MKINLFGDTGESWNDSISAAECVNMVPVISKPKKSLIFQKMPGTEILYDSGTQTDQIYGIFSPPDTKRIYFTLYNGTNIRLHYFDQNMTHGSHATNLTGLNIWAIDEVNSGAQMILASTGQSGYNVVTLGGTPAGDTIALKAGIGVIPTEITYFDGFFFMTSDDRKIYSTEFGGVDFDATRYGLVTSAAGNIVSHASDKRELWVFCTRHTEVWYNTGANGFPLKRNQGVHIDVGLFAKNSLVTFSNTMMFVGIDENGLVGVYKTEGYRAVDVTPEGLRHYFESSQTATSNSNLDNVLFSDARPLVYFNTSLYILNFKDSSIGTWVYNLKTGLWSKEKTGIGGSSKYARLHSSAVVVKTSSVVNTYNLVVPYSGTSGNVPIYMNEIHFYSLARNIEEFTTASGNDQETKEFTLVSNYILGEDDKHLKHNELRLKFNPLSSSEYVTIYYSDDNGSTWNSLGNHYLDENSGLIILRQLGRSTRRLYKVSGSISYESASEPNIPITLTDAYINVEQLDV